MNHSNKLILVGDNPFHGVSHLSRERALQRDSSTSEARFAAELVMKAITNGATGFTFTVSQTTLAILDEINKSKLNEVILYPLVPNVTEMVRRSGSAGGIPGLAKELAGRLVLCLNRRLMLNLVKGVLTNNPSSLFKSYILYEYLQLQRVIKKGHSGCLRSILLHEIVTDMALALEMEWVFRAHIGLMTELGLRPGFETRNLPYMVRQFNEWQIGTNGMVIEAPFNAIGFQMCPSKVDCEEALKQIHDADVIAFSVMAAGYLKPSEAFNYISTLEGLSGITVGVSNEKQAVSTFSLAKQMFT